MGDDRPWLHRPPTPDSQTFPAALGRGATELPFLGRLSCSHDELVAGVWEEIILEYVVGESGIADGARLKIAFKFYTDWALLQTSAPTAAHFVSAD